MTKASDLFVACLEQEGVEYVFGVPGEENLDLLDSLSRSKQIRLILTRHEQGAGFMAATYGRHTGKVGVCLATLGPGALNFSTGAAYAHLGAMPMILLTGQKAIMTAKQARFQIVEYLRAFLFGRLGWSPLNAVLIISGAFGLFDRERPAIEAALPGRVKTTYVENVAEGADADDETEDYGRKAAWHVIGAVA